MKKTVKSLILLSSLLLTSCQTTTESLQDAVISNHSSNAPVTSSSDYANFAVKTLSLLENDLSQDSNCVNSPLSYSMCLAGLAFASENADSLLETLGYEDISDLKELIELTNWNNSSKSDTFHTIISSIVFHQLIDSYGNYSFDEECRQTLADNYVSTARSPLSTYYEEACDIIEEACEKELSVPMCDDIGEGAALVYSALSLSDNFQKHITTATGTFYGETTQENIEGMSFDGEGGRYYETVAYQAFNLNINYSDLLIFLPKDGYSTSDINLSEAYEEFNENATYQYIEGFVPYFSVSSEWDYTKQALSAIGDTDAFVKLLPGNSSSLAQCKQNADFELSQYGVEGSAVTVAESWETAVFTTAQFTVDRPFKAVSTYEGLPLFAMNVTSVN